MLDNSRFQGSLCPGVCYHWVRVQPQEEATSLSLSFTQRDGQGMRERGRREGGGWWVEEVGRERVNDVRV